MKIVCRDRTGLKRSSRYLIGSCEVGRVDGDFPARRILQQVGGLSSYVSIKRTRDPRQQCPDGISSASWKHTLQDYFSDWIELRNLGDNMTLEGS